MKGVTRSRAEHAGEIAIEKQTVVLLRVPQRLLRAVSFEGDPGDPGGHVDEPHVPEARFSNVAVVEGECAEDAAV